MTEEYTEQEWPEAQGERTAGEDVGQAQSAGTEQVTASSHDGGAGVESSPEVQGPYDVLDQGEEQSSQAMFAGDEPAEGSRDTSVPEPGRKARKPEDLIPRHHWQRALTWSAVGAAAGSALLWMIVRRARR